MKNSWRNISLSFWCNSKGSNQVNIVTENENIEKSLRERYLSMSAAVYDKTIFIGIYDDFGKKQIELGRQYTGIELFETLIDLLEKWIPFQNEMYPNNYSYHVMD